jgi:hypothetical protein
MIISAIIKKGIVYEGRNCDMELDIPIAQVSENSETKESIIKVRFKAEHMTLKIERE